MEADGHATALCGVGAMVLSADCLPVALGNAGAVAMLHAGWRGLAAGVLEQGVQRDARARRRTRQSPRSWVPAQASAATRWGRRCIARSATPAATAATSTCTRSPASGCWQAGVAHVQAVDACTICDERFFSHRREGPRAGRQAGIAWLS